MKLHMEHPALPKGVTLTFSADDMAEYATPGALFDAIEDHVYAVRASLRKPWVQKLYSAVGLA